MSTVFSVLTSVSFMPTIQKSGMSTPAEPKYFKMSKHTFECASTRKEMYDLA